jgi:TolB protein
VFDLINPTRRSLFLASLPWLISGANVAAVMADERVFSIAVLNFQATTPDMVAEGRDLAQAILSDLRSSGKFASVDPNLFGNKSVNIDTAPQFRDWQAIGVDYLLIGRVARHPSGRVWAAFRLWDVTNGVPVAGQQYVTPDPSGIPHAIADLVFERVTTGQPGRLDDENKR